MFALIPFLIFFFSNLQLLFLFSLFWGMAIGIQSPSMFTQIAILEEKTNKIFQIGGKTFSKSFSWKGCNSYQNVKT